MDGSEIVNEQTVVGVRRRLLSRNGRKKRMLVIDNVQGYFRCATLASMVTQSSLTGIAPYGHGEETRPNDLTYVITSNSATVDRDLSARSFVIHVVKPSAPKGQWEASLIAFVREHRLQVIADIIGLLNAGPRFDFAPVTRFRAWEAEVFVPVCGTMDAYSEAIKAADDRRTESDGDLEEAEHARDIIVAGIRDIGLDPAEPAFIENLILRQWLQKEIPGMGGTTGKAIPHILRNWCKTRAIPELSITLTRWPVKTGKRGLAWNVPSPCPKGIVLHVIGVNRTSQKSDRV